MVAKPCAFCLLGVFLACFCAIAACRSSETPGRAAPDAAPARGGELVASIRSDPPTYNRYVAAGAVAATDVVTFLTQAPLVRVNRATDEIEPWLAESWTPSEGGLTYTLALKPGIVFSDGVPFTSADVLFSFRAALDPAVASPLASALTIHGRPLAVTAPDARTVVVRFPESSAAGLRVLDNLPILPRHSLEPRLNAGQFQQAWAASKPVTDVVGLGPFQLVEHAAGQRLVFARNPHYFRRDASGVQLPYLDRLTLVVVPDQNTEALRLEASESDLMSNGDIRPQDYAAFKRLADQGRLRMLDVSVALDADFLSFNLRPARVASRRAPWLARKEFRQALSCGVDREAIINTVYLGAAAPLYGPVTPGNRRWYSPVPPLCAAVKGDRDRARRLLAAAGLTDRDGDGMLDDESGAARFSILTHAGHLRERVASVLQEQLRLLGIAVDIVPLDPKGLQQRWMAGDYDAIYFGLQSSSTDPDPDFWMSSGPYHFWNPGQASPATPWERRIDELMREQATAAGIEQRRRAFAEVQRIFGDELPSIYFVVSRVTLATSTRVVNPTPAPLAPHLLWSADTLAVAR
jgi:peptide/nickel transport system substrate-binding protein